MRNWSTMPITTPPLAEPSSLVTAREVTSVARENSRACWKAFWPVVASRTRSTSCGPSGTTLRMTLRILVSSFIKSIRLCRRPAVSINTTSAPFATALRTVSYATEAGSEPIAWRTISTPARSAQIWSWSTAAARKVSAAPMITFLPWARREEASLPTVVVLPTPLTPTTSTT